MASKSKILGLTVEIGGDTTQLGKALEDVNKKSRDLSGELGQINKLLKMDPGNADLLAQKQKVLAEAVSNTSEKLDKLKEAEKQVQKQFEKGEASEEQVRELQREIVTTEKKLDSYKGAVKETADALDGLENKSRAAKNASEGLGDTLDTIGNVGLGAVTGAVAGAVGALTAAAEETREYRTEMSKLDTAFQQSGFSAGAAYGAYSELQGILGETDQAVEAANHLAKLTDNEKDLSTWTGKILPGVFATFGASLPIEGLTEAANETAKVGQVTGPLADALNWAGVSEDAFNEKLAECTTEQERQALITETLAGLYGDASTAYKETNADVIAANKANEEWTASLAQVGAEVEPLLTKVKSFGAELLSGFVPAIQFLLDNLPMVGVVLAGVTAAMASYKIAALAAKAASEGMTLAQYAMAAAQKLLNAVFAANPFGIIILGITALVAAFMYLWKNCEGFRNFWINLWENIKTWTSQAIDAVVGFFSGLPGRIQTWLSNTITRVTTWASNMASKAREMGSNFISAVVSFFQNLPQRIGYFIGYALGTVARWVVNMVTNARQMGTQFLQNVVSFFTQLPGRIATFLSNAVTRTVSWVTNMVSKARSMGTQFLQSVVSFFQQLPGKIATFLQNVISKVTTWGTNLVSKGKSAAKNLVDAVVNGIKSLPTKMATAGKNLVEGLWNGIKGATSWIKEKISSFGSGIISGFKDAFGINSPSKETAILGGYLDEGLAKGMEDNADSPMAAMRRVTGGVLGAAESEMNGLALERNLRSGTAFSSPANMETGNGGAAILDKLDRLYERLGRLQIVLDTGTLVGETIDKIDAGLGDRQLLRARGV